MLRRDQKIAIRRRGIDAGQHRHRPLKDLIVPAHANAGQVLVLVDDARLVRGRLKQIMNGAHTDGYAQQVAQKLDNATVRAVADQRQRDDHLTQPSLGDWQLEQRFVFRRGGQESVIQCGARLVCLLVNEFAAHSVSERQIAYRLRLRQRLNGQVLAITFLQPCRRANTPIHARPP